MRRLSAEIRLPFYFALLAETLGRVGLVDEAFASLSTGFAFLSKNSEEWAAAELHRVQGKLLAAEGKSESARASFQQGIAAARRSGSLALERRLSILADGTAAALRYRTLLERYAGQNEYVGEEIENRTPAARSSRYVTAGSNY